MSEAVAPPSTHDQFIAMLDKLYKEEIAKQQQRKIDAIKTDETLSKVAEINEAMAFNAGLTKGEYHALFNTYGSLAPDILKVLTENRASSIGDAIKLIYHEAGDEAGIFVDWLGKEVGKEKFYPWYMRTKVEKVLGTNVRRKHPVQK